MFKTVISHLFMSCMIMALVAVSVPTHSVHAATNSQYAPESLEEMIAYLFGIITQLQAQLDAQNGGTSGTTNTSNSSQVSVTTLSPTSTSRYEATVRAEARTRSQSGDVWFEYGTDGDLDVDTEKKSFSANHSVTFTSTIEDLRSNTRYSYRAVLREDDGDYTYGQIKTFTTDSSNSSNSSSNNDDEPEVETTDVDDISGDNATIFGFIDMNDFEEGTAFFVYGRNDDLVNDVENDYEEYGDIVAPVNGFGKALVDKSFSGNDEISFELDGLVEDSTYYYRACVEYDEDSNDYVIICGDTEDFESDN